MQQGSQVVISIRRCQSIFLFNTSINKSDWYCGLLTPPPRPRGTLFGRMGKCEGKANFGREVPAGRARPDPPFPPPLLPLSGLRDRLQPGRGAGGGGRSRRDSLRGLSGFGRAKLTQLGEMRSILFAPRAGGVHTRLDLGPGPPVLVDLYLSFTYLSGPPPPSHRTQL